MPISNVYEPVPGVRVALWHLVEDESALYALFPAGTRRLADEALAGVAHATRRCERLAARLALLQLGVSAPVVYTSQGKPEIFDESAHISISHTRGWVAVTVSSRPIGVDVERWSARPLRAAARFLSERERDWLSASDGAADAATLLWSAKEAVYKVLGAEGVDFSQHLRVLGFLFLGPTDWRGVEGGEYFCGKKSRGVVF